MNLTPDSQAIVRVLAASCARRSIVFWVCLDPTPEGSLLRRVSCRPPANYSELLVRYLGLISASPKQNFVEPSSVNALGLYVGFHPEILRSQRGDYATTVKMTRAEGDGCAMSNDVKPQSRLRVHHQVGNRVREFPLELCRFVRVLRRWATASHLDVAVGDRRPISETHPSKPLEEICGDELSRDFRVLHTGQTAARTRSQWRPLCGCAGVICNLSCQLSPNEPDRPLAVCLLVAHNGRAIRR